MKIACVLTTINVPKVLVLYAKHDPDVMFFVIGDRKTPDMDVADFLLHNVPNHAYYDIDRQYQLGYKCARLIPENCIQRRNIGFLEALRWGADVVVSIDDDNIPINDSYFLSFEECFVSEWHGLKATSPSGWFDAGRLLLSDHEGWPESRGFPYDKRAYPEFAPVVEAKIGVAAGICLGDPDIGACERIVTGPVAVGVNEVLRGGVIIDPKDTWTVFNSQNTAVIRELVPAWFMFPYCGRFDDIFASLVVQAVAREKGYCVHFGQPFVWQQRNAHNLIVDLRNEIDGMEHVVHFAAILDHMQKYAVDKHPARQIFEKLSAIDWFPKQASEAALAWMDDCEKIMK